MIVEINDIAADRQGDGLQSIAARFISLPSVFGADTLSHNLRFRSLEGSVFQLFMRSFELSLTTQPIQLIHLFFLSFCQVCLYAFLSFFFLPPPPPLSLSLSFFLSLSLTLSLPFFLPSSLPSFLLSYFFFIRVCLSDFTSLFLLALSS